MMNQRGYTLLELLVTLAFVAVLAGSATFQARALSDPLQNQSAQVLSFIKLVRARAVSTTSSYLIYPTSSKHIAVARGSACPAAIPSPASSLVGVSFTADTINLSIKEKVTFSSQTWAACVTQRGLFTGSSSVQVVDTSGASKTITIFLGGATRIQ